MPTTDQELAQAKDLFVANSAIMHQVVNGDDTTSVAIQGGSIDSIKKLQKNILGDYSGLAAALADVAEIAENVANKATDFTTVDDVHYPTVKAVKGAIDAALVGVLNDRGSYDASGNTFPSAGGSGDAGAVRKGDMWYVAVAGILGGVSYNHGDSIRAMVDNPGQSGGNWDGMESNLGYVPYNATNPAGYTANSTDAVLLARANHTGTQPAATIVESATQVFVTPAEKAAVTHTNRAALDAVSGNNTGDETQTTILNKLGATVVTGANTGDQTLAGLGGEAAANKVTNFSAPSDVQFPTSLAVKTLVDASTVGLLNDRGNFDASVNTFPTVGGSGLAGAVRKGDMWFISVAGTLGGVAYNKGDSIRALADAPAQVAANWDGLESNIGYVPYNATNPSGFTANQTDAYLLDRTHHTGTQPAATIVESGTQVFVAPAEKTAITHTNRAALDLVSGTNTGDETLATLKTKLGVTTLSGANTGDETQTTILTKLGATAVTGSNTGDQTLAGLGGEPTANKATDFTALDNTHFPTTLAVKTAIDARLTGVLNDRGNFDASVNAFPAANGSGNAGAIQKGDFYYISVAGSMGGVAVNIGDSVRALANAPGQTVASWNVLESNIGYVPYNATNPAGYTANSTDAVLLARANHTGTQPAATIVESATQVFVAPAEKTAITHANRAALDLVAGTNTGDETKAGILTKLGATAVTGSNTGDETQATILTKVGATALTGSNTGDETQAGILGKLGIASISGVNTGDQTLASLGAEAVANKATDFTVVNNTKYPTVQAVKAYADSLVAGAVVDCGNWDASGNVFPTTGGTGAAGAIAKGNLFFVSVAGVLGGLAVNIGDSFRALSAAPGQTAAGWDVLESNIGYVPANATTVLLKDGSVAMTGALQTPGLKVVPATLTAPVSVDVTAASITAGSTGAGSAVNITAGDAATASTNQLGGAVVIKSGKGVGSNAGTPAAGRGGPVTITAGDGSPVSAGGLMNINAGNGGATGGSGGAVAISAGGATSGNGGAVSITAGASAAGPGGAVQVTAGGGTAGAGAVTINAGVATSSGISGSVSIAAGVGSSAVSGGSVSIAAGTASGSAVPGKVTVNAPGGMVLTGGQSFTQIDKGSAGAGTTVTFDATASVAYKATVAAAQTWAFVWPATGILSELAIEVVNGGAAAITFPASVQWPLPTTGAPAASFSAYLTAIGRSPASLQASGTDTLIFWTTNGGTTVTGKIGN